MVKYNDDDPLRDKAMDDKNVKNHLMELIEFTDPYCTWCWGSEPVLRKIGEVYGIQVKIGYVMGGLVKDIKDFYDPQNRIGGEDWGKQVAEHWLEASEVHGMPVDEKVFYDIENGYWSTYPANVAVKAAEFQGIEISTKFLRRLREAASAERKQIHKEVVQAALAREVGLDQNRLLSDIRSGVAREAFDRDLATCRTYGVSGFPTFLIRDREGNENIIRGYHQFEYFEEAFRDLSLNVREQKQEFNEANVLRFIRKHGRVATIEVAVLFNVSKVQASQSLAVLTEKKRIYKVKAGNDFFWTFKFSD